MPLIQVFTSANPAEATRDKLLRELSGALAGAFEKPESYVMTCLVPGLAMTFGGSKEPACFAAIKNIGKIPAAKSAKISADLTSRLSAALGVPSSRIYLEFNEATGHLWGYDGGTFG
jgi:phenylpyruvate tautomerase PptA (4-oxalocrotonate tautomerase family)